MGYKISQCFFEKYFTTAEINDPTVFEWINLILYSVVLFVSKMNSDAHKKELIAVADFLVREVLTQSGKYATNHLITRNYAFSTFNLVSRKFEEVALLGASESIAKNFKKFGLIQWDESEDLNKDDYRDGNSLIHYHFEKEKMPSIMVGRGNEYNPTPEYKSTLARLRWRAYQLGYQFDMFGEIDKKIARYQHYGEAYRKTERYADKYIEIAYMEYCGFLAARGKLKSYEDIGNLRKFEPKVDLSIKNNLKRDGQRLVKKNYIDSQVSLQEWGSDHSVPDINEFLLRNDFTEKHDRFILLNGLVHQHNKSFERQIFFQVDTIFVNSKVLKQACQAFKKSKKFGWANHSAPSSTHIHESEIPDADVIPHNDFTEWHYSISSKTVESEYTKFDLIKNGRILEEEDANHVWENVLNNNGYIVAQRENRSDFRVPFVRFASPITIDISLEEAFKQMGIELKEVTIKKKEVEEIDKKLQVFIPVRQLKDKFYLCKNIIDHFKLSSKIDDTDLFDPDGNLASFNFTFEVEYVDQENFTYLRKDLLDRYLQEKELTMFTIIWGERDYYPPDGDWMRRTEKIMNRKWSEFYEWREYKM